MLFGNIVDLLCKLLAALFGERRNGNAHQLAVVRRIQAEVGRANSFLDINELRRVPRLHGEHLRLRRMHGSHLVERRRRAVIIDGHRVEQAHRRASGAHGGQLPAHVVDRMLHARLGFFDDVFFCHSSSTIASGVSFCSKAPVESKMNRSHWNGANSSVTGTKRWFRGSTPSAISSRVTAPKSGSLPSSPKTQMVISCDPSTRTRA